MKSRQKYLNEQWTPYPTLLWKDLGPMDHLGRVLEWIDSDRMRIYDFSPQGHPRKMINLNLAEFTIDHVSSDSQNLQKLLPREILTSGDLIWIRPQVKEITLITPCQSNDFLSTATEYAFYLQRAEAWLNFIARIRVFWQEKGFLEIPTPKLVDCPGTEPSIDFFTTEYKLGSKLKKYYLPTSPEYHLKKALSYNYGQGQIFEIAPCFRNGEWTQHHRPEFLMLEWYRSFSDLNNIQKDVCDLIQYLCLSFQQPQPETIIRKTVADLFYEFCGFPNFTPSTTVTELRNLARRLDVDTSSATSIDDIFFLIFNQRIESQFNLNRLYFVEKYPPYQAALAKIDLQGWGDRFEVYWRGLELGNAFFELNDPQQQRLRCQGDLAKKLATQKEIPQLDLDFFACLDYGMPPAAGIAVGLERLYMAIFNIPENISECQIFRRSPFSF